MKVIAFLTIAICALGLSHNALSQDDIKAQKGEKIYNNYCYTCHGEDLVNSGQSFDLRKLKVTERPRFENSVQNGKNQMPPWRGVITEQDMDMLWAYIRTKANDR